MHFGHGRQKYCVILSELCEGVCDVDISHHSDVFLEQNLFLGVYQVSPILVSIFPFTVDKHICDFKPDSVPMRRHRNLGRNGPLLPTST